MLLIIYPCSPCPAAQLHSPPLSLGTSSCQMLTQGSSTTHQVGVTTDLQMKKLRLTSVSH
jgi:hypothetical protein